MCGIAGVIAFDDRFAIDRQGISVMSACIAHRGPDAQGLWMSGDGRAALAHRRLSIIDVDARSNQPFSDGQRHLVFNGEIYNFRELRTQLSASDYQWRTMGDTEVVLRAYAVWGLACIERFEGMYAFAIWDESQQMLFLARDPMGQKPLYVADAGGAIAFASEINAIKSVGWVKRGIDPSSLSAYLQWGYVPHPRTMYAAIDQLPPGSRMAVSAKTKTIDRFVDPNSSREIFSGDRVEHTRHLVHQAVRSQLVSDVPVGCFLSGGIDSSIIASSMQTALGKEQRILTFSAGFDDPRHDERSFAREVAAHLGTKHHEFLIRPDAANDLPLLAARLGEPFADSSALPTYYLSREVRQHVKVALSGDGGDELFGGYDRYRAMRISQRLQSAGLGGAANVLGKLISCLRAPHAKGHMARLSRLLVSLSLPPEKRYSAYLRLFDDRQIAALLRQGLPQEDLIAENYLELSRSRAVVEAAAACDRELYLPDDLLAKVDRCSMSYALEVRSPFMDRALLRFTSSLSADDLLRGGSKSLLRRTFASDLPPAVFSRRKMGFAVPIGSWFRGELRDMLRGKLLSMHSFARTHFDPVVVQRLLDEHDTSFTDHSQRLYALLMLELWHDAENATASWPAWSRAWRH